MCCANVLATEETPQEYPPNLLQIVRLFRESVMLKPAEDSFRQGWKETMAGETRPVSELWDGIVEEWASRIDASWVDLLRYKILWHAAF